MDQALTQIFAEFVTNPVSAGMAMRRLLESNREEFFLSSLPYLRLAQDQEMRGSSGAQGFNYLLTLLLMNDLILEQLTNTSLFSFAEAVSLARQLLRIEPLLDIKMVRTLLDTKDISSREEFERKANSERGIRLLEIMAAISDGARILPVMAQLLQHPDSRVRSKAALLVGRSNKNYRWVEQRMTEDDPRVRANAIESLWDVDSEGTRHVFWAATADPDNRVAGNAVYGLYKLGEPASIPLLLQMMEHAQADFRVTAIWIMGETGDPRFLPVLARVMGDSESQIRAAVFRAIGRLKQGMAKFSTSAPLDINVGQVETAPDGWLQLPISVSLPNTPGQTSQGVPGLKPTQFVIYDDTTLVSEYEVSEKTLGEALTIAFALPRTVDMDGLLHRNLEQAFSQTMHRKRKNDAWVTLRYLCEKEREQPAVTLVGTPVASRNRSGILNINQALQLQPQAQPEQLAIPPDLRFSTEPEAILSAVSSPGSRLSSAPNLAQAARILVSTVAPMRGSRHVILMHQPGAPQPTPTECNEIVRAARSAKTRIHVISPEPVLALGEVCARTAGVVVERPLEELSLALEGLYASLVSHYQIRLRSENSGAALKIQVFCKQGTGEKVIARTAMAEMEPVLT